MQGEKKPFEIYQGFYSTILLHLLNDRVLKVSEKAKSQTDILFPVAVSNYNETLNSYVTLF